MSPSAKHLLDEFLAEHCAAIAEGITLPEIALHIGCVIGYATALGCQGLISLAEQKRACDAAHRAAQRRLAMSGFTVDAAWPTEH